MPQPIEAAPVIKSLSVDCQTRFKLMRHLLKITESEHHFFAKLHLLRMMAKRSQKLQNGLRHLCKPNQDAKLTKTPKLTKTWEISGTRRTSAAFSR